MEATPYYCQKVSNFHNCSVGSKPNQAATALIVLCANGFFNGCCFRNSSMASIAYGSKKLALQDWHWSRSNLGITTPSWRRWDLFTRIKAFSPHLGHFQPVAGGTNRRQRLVDRPFWRDKVICVKPQQCFYPRSAVLPSVSYMDAVSEIPQ